MNTVLTWDAEDDAFALSRHRHVLVLAGGDGTRLRAETQRRFGTCRPKQYCDFDGGGTLLGQTLRRVASVAPARRTWVSTARAHRELADASLTGWPGVRSLEQPENRDTAPGILLPMLHIARSDPDAVVCILPSDHHFSNSLVLREALDRATEEVNRDGDHVWLLGVRPSEVTDGYGWIVPSLEAGERVERFVEKPPRGAAERLLAQGALCNTMIIVARADLLCELFARFTPMWHRALDVPLISASQLRGAYSLLPPRNFSTDVLQRIPERLRLLPLEGAGWSDVGTPERLRAAFGPGERRL